MHLYGYLICQMGNSVLETCYNYMSNNEYEFFQQKDMLTLIQVAD